MVMVMIINSKKQQSAIMSPQQQPQQRLPEFVSNRLNLTAIGLVSPTVEERREQDRRGRRKFYSDKHRRTDESICSISNSYNCYTNNNTTITRTTSNLTTIWSLLLAALSLAIMANFVPMARSAKLPDIYWNSSNPIFRIDNTDHIFDVNKKQHDHDQVDLVCPQPSLTQQTAAAAAASAPSQEGQPQQKQSNGTNVEQERYIIYSVSKDEYDNCRLNGPGRVVAVCDQRDHAKVGPPVTVTFRSFTPQPNGLEFKAGQDYYFISALINYQNDPQRRFSPCREQNMKVIFKVCCKSALPVGGGGQQPSGSSNQASESGGGNIRNRAGSGSNLPTFRPTHDQARRQPQPITYKPSLAPSAAGRPLQAYLSTLAPVTVLPIEVLQPSSSESSGGSSSSNNNNNNNNQVVSDFISRGESNDIFQNEQPPPSSSPSPSPANQAPQLPVGGGGEQQAQNFRRVPMPPMVPFNPSASPDLLMVRWTPTPLPAELTRPNRQPAAGGGTWQINGGGGGVQRQPQPQPEPWHLPSFPRPPPRHIQYQQAPQAANSNNNNMKDNIQGGRHPLYPGGSIYSTYAPNVNPNGDLITVSDQQQNSAGFISASPTWLIWSPLLALALFAWWRLRPRAHLLPTSQPIGALHIPR